MTGAPSSAATSDAVSPRGRHCADCQGPLSEPISGDVHCFVVCQVCGAKFMLDDPRIGPPG